MRPIRFYTLPPRKEPYPFVLMNAQRPRDGLRYLRKFSDHVKAVIIDAGVEVFRKFPNLKDYPEGAKGRIAKIVELYHKVRMIVPKAEVYAVVCDYPDDYAPCSLWADGKTNIERTVENVLYAVDAYPDVNWIIPVQGWNRKPASIWRSVSLYAQHGILKRFDYFAIANLCVERRDKIVEETIRQAFLALKGKKLHAFGLKMTSIARVWHMLRSFDSSASSNYSLDHHWAEYLVPRAISLLFSTDSTAWTRPCGLATKIYLNLLYRCNASRKSDEDSIVYFWAWLYTLVAKYKVPLEGMPLRYVRERFVSAIEKALEGRIPGVELEAIKEAIRSDQVGKDKALR